MIPELVGFLLGSVIFGVLLVLGSGWKFDRDGKPHACAHGKAAE